MTKEKESTKGFDASKFESETVHVSTEYWDFNENDLFRGYFKGDFISPDPDKKEEVIGYLFEEYETKDIWIISNSYAITKSLETETNKVKLKDEENVLLEFKFLGQGVKADGQAYNKFMVMAYRPKTSK